MLRAVCLRQSAVALEAETSMLIDRRPREPPIAHGRFNGTIKVEFNAGKPTKASITVEAKSADGSTVDSTWITVTPLR
jgi:hypothetical protein